MEENSVHLLKNGRTLGSRYVIEGVLVKVDLESPTEDMIRLLM